MQALLAAIAGYATKSDRAGIISANHAERMRKSVGFRNIAVHQSQALDWEIVYAVSTRHLDDFRMYAQELLDWLDNH